MNSHHEFDDNRQLDRLVDGELSGDEYREFLATLDKEPDGWRRCAMAFLEDQAWGQEFGELRGEALSSRQEVSSKNVGHSVSNWSARQLVALTLAMAASFAVAFASGVWWHGGDSSNPDAAAPMVVQQHSDSREIALDEERPRLAKDESTPGSVPTEYLTFVVDRGNGQTERFELPVYNANDSVARQLLQNMPSMPADVERAIRDAGYRVKSQRHWAPVTLRDGRRAFFPVDQIDITPVSGDVYQ